MMCSGPDVWERFLYLQWYYLWSYSARAFCGTSRPRFSSDHFSAASSDDDRPQRPRTHPPAWRARGAAADDWCSADDCCSRSP